MTNVISKEKIWEYIGKDVWAEWCGGCFEEESGRLVETHFLFEITIDGILLNDKPPLGTEGFRFTDKRGKWGNMPWEFYGVNMVCFEEKPDVPYFTSWMPMEEGWDSTVYRVCR